MNNEERMNTGDTLLAKYIDIYPQLEKLYVDPWPESNDNEYLQLLYHGVFKKLKIKNLKRTIYPLLFFYKIFGMKLIVHHHWFDARTYKSAVTIIWKLVWLFMFKAVGGKIVWTVHNKYPHHGLFIKFNKYARILMAFIATDLHVHCSNVIVTMSQILKVSKDKFFVVKHPNYEVDIFSQDIAIDKFEKKYQYKIDQSKTIFLIFGQIAKYKGIRELLEIINEIEDDFVLIIAGKIKEKSGTYFSDIKKLIMNRKIIVLDSFILADDVPILFNVSDYVVFNYKDILTSGAVILALNYKKNTIAPHKGCISDIENKNLITFETEDELRSTLLNVIKRNK